MCGHRHQNAQRHARPSRYTRTAAPPWRICTENGSTPYAEASPVCCPSSSSLTAPKTLLPLALLCAVLLPRTSRPPAAPAQPFRLARGRRGQLSRLVVIQVQARRSFAPTRPPNTAEGDTREQQKSECGAHERDKAPQPTVFISRCNEALLQPLQLFPEHSPLERPAMLPMRASSPSRLSKPTGRRPSSRTAFPPCWTLLQAL